MLVSIGSTHAGGHQVCVVASCHQGTHSLAVWPVSPLIMSVFRQQGGSKWGKNKLPPRLALLKSFLEALPSDLLATLGCRKVWVM